MYEGEAAVPENQYSKSQHKSWRESKRNDIGNSESPAFSPDPFAVVTLGVVTLYNIVAVQAFAHQCNGPQREAR
jgi:hypothetical protein